jgi:hypothetical protein
VIVVGHGEKYAMFNSAALRTLALPEAASATRLVGCGFAPIGCWWFCRIREQRLPRAGDCLLVGLQTVSYHQVAARPTEHLEECWFASQFTNLCMNDATARKVNASANVAPVESYSPRRQNAALDSNQVMQCNSPSHSGENLLFNLGVWDWHF